MNESITIYQVIKELIINPKSDQEIEYNNALIKLLKESISCPAETIIPYQNSIDDKLSKVIEKIRSILSNYGLNLSYVSLCALAQFWKDNAKLVFVKELKVQTDLRLEELKNITDIIFPQLEFFR